jgi:hypothetical protein
MPAMSPAPATSNEEVNEAALEAAADTSVENSDESVETTTEAMDAVENEQLPYEEPPFDHDEQPDVVVNPDIPRDPSVSVASALLAISRVYNDAELIGAALTTHMVKNAEDHELHAVLSRMNVSLGDFCHSFRQIEQQMPERVRDAIIDALT